MGLDKPKRATHFAVQKDLSGYESAQRKRFLRSEIEEEKQAAAEGADTSSGLNAKQRD